MDSSITEFFQGLVITVFVFGLLGLGYKDCAYRHEFEMKKLEMGCPK